MPLNNSGQISIGGSTLAQSINMQLGRSTTQQSALNETALRNLAGKTSGAIALSDFYGKGVNIIDVTVSENQPVGPVYASYGLRNDGYYLINGTLVDSEHQWIRNVLAAPGSYEARATLVSGALYSGTLNTWLALTTTREWAVRTSGFPADYQSAQLTIEIRANSVVLDSATIILEATETGL